MTDPEIRQRLAEPDSVAVVGASGRMGQMLMEEGTAAGIGMVALSRPYKNADVLGRAKLVIFSVPAAVFEDVMVRLCPFTNPEAVVCDVTSVKLAPITQMLRHWPGDVVGSHPLFGPVHEPEPPVAMVRSSRCSDEGYQLADGFFRLVGYSTFDTDADTHDKAIARIQLLNFITSLAYCAQTANDETLKQFITPSFKRRLEAARRLLTEDGKMFAGLFEANPYSQKAVRQFSNLLSLASAGDIDLLLSRACQWWPEAKS